MGNNVIQIVEPVTHTITIDTSFEHNNNQVVIQLRDINKIELINKNISFVSNLPEGYPLNWTVGDLPASRISDLPVSNILPGNYITILNSGSIFNISATGLQPSGNYSTIGHLHLSNEISDFIIAVSGASPVQSVAGKIGNILLDKNDVGLDKVDNTRDIDKPISYAMQSGLNFKSDIGHQHISTNIIDFNSSVSGLLPVKNISSGSGINITNNNGDFNVAVTGQFGLTSEQVDDRVSNLLVGINNIILNYDDNLDKLTIGTSGLQPSGNYSVIGHSHSISDVSGLQNALDNKQPSGSYAPLAHSHTSSNITDFSSSVNSLVSGLYAPLNSPNFSGVPTAPTANSGNNSNQIANTQFVRSEISNLINSAPNTLDTLNELASALGNDPNFATTISNTLGTKANLSGANFTGNISGPSGNFSVLKQNNVIVSVSGHSHVSSDITNFNSSVSGLLPVTNIFGGTNINIATSGTAYTINVSGQLGLTEEEVDDRVSGLLKAGSGISLNYDDPNNLLTISATGLQPSGNYSVVGHSHTSSNITDFNSTVSGIVSSGVNTSLIAGTGISLDYFSNNDTLVISTSGVSLVGHKHIASEINDFTSAVQLIKLNDLSAPTGSLNLNTQRIINVASAVSETDAVNKSYIDNLLATTGTKGIASFDSGDFSVVSGIVSIKTSGVDNNQLAYSSIVLGSTAMNLGSTYLVLNGVTIDGGTP